MLVMVSVYIGTRDRIPVNLGGSKPHPSVIFPFNMYINIYKYVLKTSSQCDRHTSVSVMLFPALPKKGNQLHTPAAILVSNLIGPVKSGQHMY